jgi:uncharacterized protein (PEP-CTERM system associated)
LKWSLSYNNIDEERKDANTINFENGFADARYRLVNSLSFLAYYGYANNDYQTTQPINNGSYWAFGLGWRPNDKLGVDAVYGNEYQSATIDWDPTSRTTLTASWRNTDIGLNAGKTWSGAFSLRTRRTEWIARYLEDTTTTQQIQVLPDAIAPPEETNQDQSLEQQSSFDFGVTDEVFVRKRGQFRINYTRAKSDLSLSVFNEKRIFLSSDTEQQSQGGGGFWNWDISGKTSFNILFRTEERLIQLGEPPDDFRLAEAGFEWMLKRPFSASATYRYTKLDSEVEGRSYEENRAILRLNMIFSKADRRL